MLISGLKGLMALFNVTVLSAKIGTTLWGARLHGHNQNGHQWRKYFPVRSHCLR